MADRPDIPRQPNHNTDNETQEVERKRAFRATYRALMRAVAKNGDPRMLSSIDFEKGGVGFQSESYCLNLGIPFVENSRVLKEYTTLGDSKYGLAIAIIGEHASNKQGVIGWFAYTDSSNTDELHVADRYFFYHNETVTHLSADLPDIELGHPDRGKQVVTDMGELDAEGIAALRPIIETSTGEKKTHF